MQWEGRSHLVGVPALSRFGALLVGAFVLLADCLLPFPEFLLVPMRFSGVFRPAWPE